MASSGDNHVLNAALLTVLIAVAGFIGFQTVEQGNTLAKVEATLEDHSKYFERLEPIVQSSAVVNRRLDDEDRRSDRIETHMEATDHRVDTLERLHPVGNPYRDVP